MSINLPDYVSQLMELSRLTSNLEDLSSITVHSKYSGKIRDDPCLTRAKPVPDSCETRARPVFDPFFTHARVVQDTPPVRAIPQQPRNLF
ncbi:hypothetical protein RRG08_067333 [Elysia crispata]|uniref:Uncharacterized protein n=1 Tax=Elysia crispata TaxID=231223 RepID=A0AAE0Z1R9_9GAST|nr:hypothetical protein RRG08_067333 [Elysia crispata]